MTYRAQPLHKPAPGTPRRVLVVAPDGSPWCSFAGPDAEYKAEQTAVALNVLETVNATRYGVPIQDLRDQADAGGRVL